MKALGEVTFPGGRAMFLIQDALMHPLRIHLDQTASGNELQQFLLWKLKKYLPYPIEQVVMRHVRLQEEGTYLTLSLPKPWLDGLSGAMEARGGHCGYIGGLFATLLENGAAFRGPLSFCLYGDCYLLAELDEKGNYVDFRTRRLPTAEAGGNRLDIDTLIRADLMPVLDQAERPLLAVNLAPERDGEFARLTDALKRLDLELKVASLAGPVLARYRSLAEGVAS